MGCDARWYAPEGTTNEQVRRALEDAYGDHVHDNLVHEWGTPSLWWNTSTFFPDPDPLILAGRSSADTIAALVAACDRLGGHVDFSDYDDVECDYRPVFGAPLAITGATTELFGRFAYYGQRNGTDRFGHSRGGIRETLPGPDS